VTGALVIAACLVWGVLGGIVFSAIGAAGGILTSFGLITLFGVMDPNSVRPMTQLVVLAAALTFVPRYLFRSALVVPLGLVLGAGGLVGAYAGSTLASLYLSDMTTFRPLFGLLTLAIAAQIAWRLVRGWRAAQRGAGQGGAGQGGPPADPAVEQSTLSGGCLVFVCAGHSFRVPLWSPLLAGAVIAMTAAIFGVGGGFLLVPYLSAMLGLPMHVVPATAAIAIFLSLAVSIANTLAMGAVLMLDLLIPMVIGTILGAWLGPQVNRALSNAALQAIMAFVVTGIGVKYLAF